ncbi:hypothetical protein RRG08_039186 [Elysia crispata]|uniref:Uncharacterized protein n=1 Tax=Elysia crispata TaxID=231223 RepID=A0AAE1DEW8_9GAST|nr:hypothetical protein RRG08_039186 [Elysia crispata]
MPSYTPTRCPPTHRQDALLHTDKMPSYTPTRCPPTHRQDALLHTDKMPSYTPTRFRSHLKPDDTRSRSKLHFSTSAANFSTETVARESLGEPFLPKNSLKKSEISGDIAAETDPALTHIHTHTQSSSPGYLCQIVFLQNEAPVPCLYRPSTSDGVKILRLVSALSSRLFLVISFCLTL